MKLHYDVLKVGKVALLLTLGISGNSVQASNGIISVQNENMALSTLSSELVFSSVSNAVYGIGSKAAEGTPSIELSERRFDKARGKVGEKVVIAKVHVKAVDLATEVSIVPSGAVEGIFTTDVDKLPAGTSETDVTLYYEAKKIGKNEGRLYFMAGDDALDEIQIKGLAIDPANPPAVKLTPQTYNDFKTEVGTPVKDTITVDIVGFPSPVNVAVKQSEPAFTCNTGMLYYSVPSHKVVVTFNPKKDGTFEGSLVLSNEFMDTVVVALKGTATAKEEVKPETEGDQLPLTYDNPMKLLKEGFENQERNKPLSVKGWKNLATAGTRAWWGYSFPDYDEENAGEFAAKVTAYDSKVEPGNEEFCQMILVTPPLDYKASESKVFTFRVMGNNLMENSEAQIFLCYMYELDGQLQAELIDGIAMPATPDQNGEWMDYHVDLTGQNIDDIFHMGFLFNGMRGTTCSTVYYIDDVSFGRTDLPLISPEKSEINLNASAGAFTVSDPVVVETKNLVEPVKLTLGGKDKAAFEASVKTLPKEGGSFVVKVEKGEGKREAYVKLTSRGAATKFVSFFVNEQTGIQQIETLQGEQVQIVDLSGRVCGQVDGAEVYSTLSALPSGTYVLRITGASGTRSVKVTR